MNICHFHAIMGIDKHKRHCAMLLWWHSASIADAVFAIQLTHPNLEIQTGSALELHSNMQLYSISWSISTVRTAESSIHTKQCKNTLWYATMPPWLACCGCQFKVDDQFVSLWKHHRSSLSCHEGSNESPKKADRWKNSSSCRTIFPWGNISHSLELN